MTTEELKQIKKERDEMEKHMTDMFDLAFMINNHDDLAKSQEHHEKLSRMVTHYMGSIQQSYGYMSEKAIEALEQEPCGDMGEISDGYHTFNQLYHQRAVLFATIVNEHPGISWKSFKHSDGHYCFDEDGEMFIVGIDTPEGSYTYHYHKKYWDLFKCKELERGKEWDGHTEKDVTRLLSLEQEPCNDCISRQAVLDMATTIQTDDFSGNEIIEVVEVDDVKALPPVIPQTKTECSCEQIKWERDTAIAQLKELGYGLGEKPKTGHWIHFAQSDDCSECGWSTGKYIDPSNYCPNCGADMRGDKE